MYKRQVFGIPPLRKKAHFCAISSTSGTATEVTAFSIITDYEKGIKYPIADFEITPDVAIVDPELAETMPQKLVAHTGMDAMTHAIEAYVSTANCDFTDPLALHAIEMIQTDLIPSYNGDMEKRHSMHPVSYTHLDVYKRQPIGMSNRSEEYNDAYDTAYQKQDQPLDRLASAQLYFIQFRGLQMCIRDSCFAVLFFVPLNIMCSIK